MSAVSALTKQRREVFVETGTLLRKLLTNRRVKFENEVLECKSKVSAFSDKLRTSERLSDSFFSRLRIALGFAPSGYLDPIDRRKIRKAASNELSYIEHLEMEVYQVVKWAEAVGYWMKYCEELGEFPEGQKDQLATLENAVRGRTPKWETLSTSVVAVTCVDMEKIYIAWLEEYEQSLVRQGRKREAAEAAEILPPEARIFLAVSRERQKEALARGALWDKGRKRAFILAEQVDDFNDCVPLAYRTGRKEDPISFRANFPKTKNVNIHDLFTDDDWKAAKQPYYHAAGGICVGCGKTGGDLVQGGVFADQPHVTEKTVQAHEMWEAEWINRDDDTGLLKLDTIRILCVDCHMQHHREYAKISAERNGQSAQSVDNFLLAREAAFNNLSTQEFIDFKTAEERYRSEYRSVDKWIVDLSSVASVFKANGVIPTFRTDNPAGIDPEQIAGLTFKDDLGNLYPAKSAEEAYEAVRGVKLHFELKPREDAY